MQARVTPENIESLMPDEVFVFGSNRGGTHGAGAAKTARKWGAVWGQGEGLMRQTYGIPTKAKDYRKSLSLEQIQEHVTTFIEFAKTRPELKFLVTAIGTGYAHYKVEDIAPMFKEALSAMNIWLPLSFWEQFMGQKFTFEFPKQYH